MFNKPEEILPYRLAYTIILFHQIGSIQIDYTNQEGIITKDMKRERNQKNVITLKGQVMMFTVETVFHIYTIFHISSHAMIESSFMPTTEIVASSIISVIQLTTSNEMRRFMKNQFNFY